METKTEQLIHLKELSSLMMDSINGFKQIAETTPEKELQTFFFTCENQSLLMWEELNVEIMALGGESATKGTLKGAINHLWLRMKEVVTDDLNKILKNIIFCEEFNLARYKEVISDSFPQPLLNKLTSHIAILTERIKTLEQIRDKE